MKGLQTNLDPHRSSFGRACSIVFALSAVSLSAGCGFEPGVNISIQAKPVPTSSSPASPSIPAETETFADASDAIDAADTDASASTEPVASPDVQTDSAALDADSFAPDGIDPDGYDPDAQPPSDSEDATPFDILDSSNEDSLDDGDTSCQGPTCPGALAPYWTLLDFQPASPKFRAEYGLEEFTGKVTVVTLLAGW